MLLSKKTGGVRLDTGTEAKLFLLHRDLPMLGSVMVKLYRENYNKKKREKAPVTEVGMSPMLSQMITLSFSSVCCAC